MIARCCVGNVDADRHPDEVEDGADHLTGRDDHRPERHMRDEDERRAARRSTGTAAARRGPSVAVRDREASPSVTAAPARDASARASSATAIGARGPKPSR